VPIGHNLPSLRGNTVIFGALHSGHLVVIALTVLSGLAVALGAIITSLRGSHDIATYSAIRTPSAVKITPTVVPTAWAICSQSGTGSCSNNPVPSVSE
jgi:hypothetical protein